MKRMLLALGVSLGMTAHVCAQPAPHYTTAPLGSTNNSAATNAFVAGTVGPVQAQVTAMAVKQSADEAILNALSALHISVDPLTGNLLVTDSTGTVRTYSPAQSSGPGTQSGTVTGPQLNLVYDGATATTDTGTTFGWAMQSGASVATAGANVMTVSQPVHANLVKQSALVTVMSTAPACYTALITNPTSNSLYNGGMVLWNRATGRSAIFEDVYANSAGSSLIVATQTSFAGANQNVLSNGQNQPYPSGGQFFMRLCSDGTNLTFGTSLTGADSAWGTPQSFTLAALGSPDHVGFYVDANATGGQSYAGSIIASSWQATANNTPLAAAAGGDSTQSFLTSINLPTSDTLPSISGALPDDGVTLPGGTANSVGVIFGTATPGANITTTQGVYNAFWTSFAEGTLNQSIGSPMDTGQNDNTTFAAVARTYAPNDPNSVHKMLADSLDLSNNCSQNHTHCYPGQIYGGMISAPTPAGPGQLWQFRIKKGAGQNRWSPTWFFSNFRKLNGGNNLNNAPSQYGLCSNHPLSGSIGGPCYEIDVDDAFERVMDSQTPMGQEFIAWTPNYGQYMDDGHGNPAPPYTTAAYRSYMANVGGFTDEQIDEEFERLNNINCSVSFCDYFFNWRNDGSHMLDFLVAPVTSPATPAKLVTSIYMEFNPLNNGPGGTPLPLNLIMSAAQAVPGQSLNGGVRPNYSSIQENDGIAHGWDLQIQKIMMWPANIVNPTSYKPISSASITTPAALSDQASLFNNPATTWALPTPTLPAMPVSATSGTPRIEQYRGTTLLTTYTTFSDQPGCSQVADSNGLYYVNPAPSAASGCGPFTRTPGWRLWAPGDTFLVYPAVYTGQYNNPWIGPKFTNVAAYNANTTQNPTSTNPDNITIQGVVQNNTRPVILLNAGASSNSLGQSALYFDQSTGVTVTDLNVIGQSGEVVGKGGVTNYGASNLTMARMEVAGFNNDQNCVFSGNQFGGFWSLDHMYLHDCGGGQGLSHNFYGGASLTDANYTITLTNSISTRTTFGHLFKSRAQRTILKSNLFLGGLPLSGQSQSEDYDVDIPNGGFLDAEGNMLVKGASGASTNGLFMAYDFEGTTNTTGDAGPRDFTSIIKNNTFFSAAATFDGSHRLYPIMYSYPTVNPTDPGWAVQGFTATVSNNAFAGFPASTYFGDSAMIAGISEVNNALQLTGNAHVPATDGVIPSFYDFLAGTTRTTATIGARD